MPKPKKLNKPFIIRRVVGRSMWPAIRPDQIIVVRGLFIKLRIDDIVIFEHEGKEKIKRIKLIHDNQIYLIGDNPPFSNDSRHFGWLPREVVIGKVLQLDKLHH